MRKLTFSAFKETRQKEAAVQTVAEKVPHWPADGRPRHRGCKYRYFQCNGAFYR